MVRGVEMDTSGEQHNHNKLIGSRRRVQKLQVASEMSHHDQSDELVRVGNGI